MKTLPHRTRDEIGRWALTNSESLPSPIVIDGERKRWVGIGWVSEGEPRGDEAALVYDVDDVGCPVCLATPGDPCVAPSGAYARRMHYARARMAAKRALSGRR